MVTVERIGNSFILRCEAENTTVAVDPETVVEADLIIVTRPGIKDII
jgi:hypothetical protein